MIRLASSPEPHVKSMALTASMEFNSRGSLRQAKPCSPEPEAIQAPPLCVQAAAIVDARLVADALRPVPLASTLASNPSLEIAISDWDDLFHAVEARLKAAVETRPEQALAAQPPGAASVVQTVVLECITALDQLHVALMHERQLLGRPALVDAQAAATRAFAGLVGIPSTSLASIEEPPLNDRLATLAASVTNEFGLKKGQVDAA